MDDPILRDTTPRAFTMPEHLDEDQRISHTHRQHKEVNRPPHSLQADDLVDTRTEKQKQKEIIAHNVKYGGEWEA